MMMRNNRLHCFYPMRSLDLLRYFQDDAYMAGRLVQWLIDECSRRNSIWQEVFPGTLTLHAHSLHLFEGDREVVEAKRRQRAKKDIVGALEQGRWGDQPFPIGMTVGERIDRVDLYMEIARLFAMRSTCLRGHVGCVAVKDNRIIAAGYNGSPPGMEHCLDVGCGGGVVVKAAQLDPLPGGEMPRPAEQQDTVEFPNGCTRAIHAEANMVAFAARVGTSLEGATVYATAGPCLPCAQVLVASGIAVMYYEKPYRLPQGLQLIDQANIKVVKYGEETA